MSKRPSFPNRHATEHKKLFDSKIFDHKALSFKMRKALVVLQKGLAQESAETKQMLAIYHKYTRGEATEQEMLEANQQFKDVIKGLGLSVVVILPFSPITLPAIVKLGKKVGIDVLPSAFREHLNNDNQVSEGAKTVALSHKVLEQNAKSSKSLKP